jgi:hypothetical protein
MVQIVPAGHALLRGIAQGHCCSWSVSGTHDDSAMVCTKTIFNMHAERSQDQDDKFNRED